MPLEKYKHIALGITKCFIEASGREMSISKRDYQNENITAILDSWLTRHEKMLYLEFYFHLHESSYCVRLSQDVLLKDLENTTYKAITGWKTMKNNLGLIHDEIKSFSEVPLIEGASPGNLTWKRSSTANLQQTTSQSLLAAQKVLYVIKGMNKFIPFSALSHFLFVLNFLGLLTYLPSTTHKRPILFQMAILECVLEISFHWVTFFNLMGPFIYLMLLRAAWFVLEIGILLYDTMRGCPKTVGLSESQPGTQSPVRREMMDAISNFKQELQGAPSGGSPSKALVRRNRSYKINALRKVAQRKI
mmetsp:Transcript_28543/g.34756  ORF Transcript_28543/g.34756 Transcript_28543/m.34756 type:complete len:304 (-) Transcript_28543:73-984(-)